MAFIPARSGSKSVVDKNIHLLAGYPVIAYSIAAARMSGIIGRIIVSTDSEEYAEVTRRFGGEAPFCARMNSAPTPLPTATASCTPITG